MHENVSPQSCLNSGSSRRQRQVGIARRPVEIPVPDLAGLRFGKTKSVLYSLVSYSIIAR